jgi:transcriptional regulator with XRE-family HTH domain
MSLGRRIKERRKTLGLTQQQLAEALGVTPQHISVIEQDKRAPSLSSLARMAEELGVTIDFLVVGKEGIVMGIIPAIKADKRLSLKAKKALIALVEELYETSSTK